LIFLFLLCYLLINRDFFSLKKGEFMKKLLGALIALTLSSNLCAYTLKIINSTNGQLRAHIFYGGPGVCSDDMEVINAGQTFNKSTGACCPYKIEFSSLSGSSAGRGFRYNTGKKTGFGLTCANLTVEVVTTADLSLVARTK
jgi:hypothetical protein